MGVILVENLGQQMIRFPSPARVATSKAADDGKRGDMGDKNIWRRWQGRRARFLRKEYGSTWEEQYEEYKLFWNKYFHTEKPE